MASQKQTAVFTIPRQVTGFEELVVLPRREYERLAKLNDMNVRLKDVERWSLEARQLKKAGKLPILRSLKDLR